MMGKILLEVKDSFESPNYFFCKSALFRKNFYQ